MSKKSELKSLLDQSYQAEQAVYDRLPPEERARLGTLKHWAAKDILLHSSLWTQRLMENIQRQQRGEAPKDIEKDYLEHNDQDFQANYQLSWEEVVARREAIHQLAQDILDSLSEENLHSSAWSSKEHALWREITGYVYTHPMQHLIQLYLDLDDIEHADEINDQMVENLSGLDDSPHWHGTLAYNDACHKAKTRRKKEAIKKLRKALEMRPDLTAWAQEDSDLEMLHDDPEFQAFFAASS